MHAVTLAPVTGVARVSTSEVAAAAGVKPQTVRRWAKLGLLPEATVFYGLKPGRHSFWPPHAPEQARWVAAQIMDGKSFEAIRAALAGGEFKP